jgi:thymidylate synthase
MKQYLDLLQNILDNGVEKESGRANMPNTIIFSIQTPRIMHDDMPIFMDQRLSNQKYE